MCIETSKHGENKELSKKLKVKSTVFHYTKKAMTTTGFAQGLPLLDTVGTIITKCNVHDAKAHLWAWKVSEVLCSTV